MQELVLDPSFRERDALLEGIDVDAAINTIEGSFVEQKLVELARIGGGSPMKEGIDEQDEVTGLHFKLDERYKVNRLALTAADIEARREFIAPWMQELGMEVIEHPMGTVGILQGTDTSLPPLELMSHTDSIEKADMYDGSLGVIGGLTTVETMLKAGIKPRRTIYVTAFTGEESAGYGRSLFGSEAMMHGLSDEALDSRIAEDSSSIREMVHEHYGEEGVEACKSPVFVEGSYEEWGGYSKDGKILLPGAAIELHVEQYKTLEQEGIDLAVFTDIAAPERYQIPFANNVGVRMSYKPQEFQSAYQLVVDGEAAHSGAAPMGPEHRADGMLASAQILRSLSLAHRMTPNSMSSFWLGDLIHEGQNINKVPGKTQTQILLQSSSEKALEKLSSRIVEVGQEAIDGISALPAFVGRSLRLDKIGIEDVDFGSLWTPRSLGYEKVLDFIVGVNETAVDAEPDGVRATVSMFSRNSSGDIVLGLDARGRHKEPRTKAIEKFAKLAGGRLPEKISGSDPVMLHKELGEIMLAAIEEDDIATVKTMYSPAGHDAQHTAPKIPTVMLVAQSNRGGKAHNPEAYTHPANLEKAVRALAATTIRLVA